MSEAGSDASSHISANRTAATDIGTRLADLVDDPEQFVAVLCDGLGAVSDPAYLQTVERVSPGTSSELSARGPLVAAIQRPLRRRLRISSGSSALSLAQRLIRCEERELRVFAQPCLERSIEDDPERTWQLMRQLGRRAGDWTEVDSFADLWATGILAEPFRWAELEQLVYSQLIMERRLVGATLARMPHRLARKDRQMLRVEAFGRAFSLLHQLIGDAAPMVQKSLSWAVREWTEVDPSGARSFLRDESVIALARADGNRAWVIRDALAAQLPEHAAQLRTPLIGLRRSRDAISTSIAAEQAATFGPAIEAHGTVSQQGDRYTRSRP